jgi:integrase/recombinase XerD
MKVITKIKVFDTEIGRKYLEKIKQNTKIRSNESVKVLELVFKQFLLTEFNFDIHDELEPIRDDEDLVNAKAEYIFSFLKSKTKNFKEEQWQDIAKKYAKLMYTQHVYFIQHIANFICNNNDSSNKILFKNFIENNTDYKIKKIKRDLDIIPDKELDILFINAGIHMKIIIGLFMTTGMRVNAMANIKKENIDFDKRSLITIEKGNKEVEFKISKSILNAMVESDFFSYSWPSTKIRKHLKLLGKKCNILEKYIHPHAFRHTYATMLVKQKVDTNTVSKLLHHSSISVTQQYYVIQTNYDISSYSSLPYDDGEKEKEFIPLVWKWAKGEYKI